MKRRMGLVSMLLFGMMLVGCRSAGETPVYRGMTIQEDSASQMSLRLEASAPFAISIEDAIQAHLSISSTPEADYYTPPLSNLILTVLIDNPESFEILSFTLNDVKYQSYQFRVGSDSEHLLLEIVAEATPGIQVYTIDAIKYVQGEAIKDVLLEGDRTISVGTTHPNAMSSTELLMEQGSTTLTTSFSVTDTAGLLTTQGASIHLFLYDGSILTEANAPSVGTNQHSFLNLLPDTVYQLALVAIYDLLDGEGNQMVVLKTALTATHKILELSVSATTNDTIRYALTIRDPNQIGQLVAVRLFDGETLVEEHTSVQTEGFVGLLTNHDYRLEATYSYDLGDGGGPREAIDSMTVSTLLLSTPTVSIQSVEAQFHQVSFFLAETDELDIGAIVWVRLYNGMTLVETLLNLDQPQFENLLSNHLYRIDALYRYDLSDGFGNRETTVSASFRTPAKAIPTLQFHAFRLDSDRLAFDYEVVDLHQVQIDTFLTLTKNGAQPIALTSTEALIDAQDRLASLVLTIRLTYDLGDGAGQRSVVLQWEHEGSAWLYAMENNAITLTGYTGSANELVIPTTLAGYSLIAIGTQAFKGQTTVTSITVPSSISSIGNEAFANCSALLTLKLPGTTLTLGTSLLAGSSALQTLELSSALPNELRYYFGNLVVNIPASLETIRFATQSPSINSTIARGSMKNATLELAGDMARIPEQAFKDCSGITKLIIPDSVSVIEASAFEGCVNLVDIKFSASLVEIGNWAFTNCSKLPAVHFPATLETIGAYAFWYNGSLQSAIFENGPDLIGEGAFYSCNLKTLYIPQGAGIIGLGAFQFNGGLTTVFIEEGLYEIQRNAFYDDINLSEFHFPSSLRVIGDAAFQGAPLSYIRLPDGLTTIGAQALNSLPGGAIVFVPSSVTNINYCAFGNNTIVLVEATYKPLDWHGEWQQGSTVLWGAQAPFEIDGFRYTLLEDMTAMLLTIDATVVLGDLILPETVEGHILTGFAPNVFRNRSDLLSVHISSGIQTIPDTAFDQIGSLVKVTFAENAQLQSIGAYAFSNTNLVEFEMPNSVITIGPSAFRNCPNLKTMVISDSLSIIPEYAFYFDQSLMAVDMGNSVTKIGYNAFGECRILSYIRFPDTLVEIEAMAFSANYRLFFLYLPASLQTIGVLGLPTGSQVQVYSEASSKPVGWDLTNYNGIPIVWSASIYELQGIDYVTNETGVAWVAGENPFVVEETVVIPAIAGGNQVKGILANAFRGDSTIRFLRLSSGIQEIHTMAFYQMYALETIYFPDTVVFVESNILHKCDALTSLQVQHSSQPETWDLYWTTFSPIQWGIAPPEV